MGDYHNTKQSHYVSEKALTWLRLWMTYSLVLLVYYTIKTLHFTMMG